MKESVREREKRKREREKGRERMHNFGVYDERGKGKTEEGKGELER